MPQTVFRGHANGHAMNGYSGHGANGFAMHNGHVPFYTQNGHVSHGQPKSNGHAGEFTLPAIHYFCVGVDTGRQSVHVLVNELKQLFPKFNQTANSNRKDISIKMFCLKFLTLFFFKKIKNCQYQKK